MSHFVRLFLPLALLAACAGEEGGHGAPTEPARQIQPTPPATESASGHIAPPAGTVTGVAAPADAKVMFVSPKEGETVKSPVKVVMGVEGIAIKAAGDLAPGTGHHHLIVDGGPIAEGTTVPKDAQHIHYGKGQTEAEVELTPGPHTLTLQVADGNHVSYGERVSATIHVTVQ